MRHNHIRRPNPHRVVIIYRRDYLDHNCIDCNYNGCNKTCHLNMSHNFIGRNHKGPYLYWPYL